MTSEVNIPTDEDFARADAAEKQRDKGLSDVSERIKNTFGSDGLHQIFMLFSKRSGNSKIFYVRVFYDTDSKLDEAEAIGLNDRVRLAIYENLVDVGRTDATHENIECTFDSHQNVKRVCNGNYLMYLR